MPNLYRVLLYPLISNKCNLKHLIHHTYDYSHLHMIISEKLDIILVFIPYLSWHPPSSPSTIIVILNSVIAKTQIIASIAYVYLRTPNIAGGVP